MLDMLCRAIMVVQRSRSRIADLIVIDPSGWETGHYNWTHKKTGISIWVSNELYGLNVAIGREPGPRHSGKHQDDIPLSWAERRLIWRAIANRLAADRLRRSQQLAAKLDAALLSVLSDA